MAPSTPSPLPIEDPSTPSRIVVTCRSDCSSPTSDFGDSNTTKLPLEMLANSMTVIPKRSGIATGANNAVVCEFFRGIPLEIPANSMAVLPRRSDIAVGAKDAVVCDLFSGVVPSIRIAANKPQINSSATAMASKSDSPSQKRKRRISPPSNPGRQKRRALTELSTNIEYGVVVQPGHSIHVANESYTDNMGGGSQFARMAKIMARIIQPLLQGSQPFIAYHLEQPPTIPDGDDLLISPPIMTGYTLHKLRTHTMQLILPLQLRAAAFNFVSTNQNQDWNGPHNEGPRMIDIYYMFVDVFGTSSDHEE